MTSRYGDAAAPGFRGGRVVVGFNVALAATLITCDGTTVGDSHCPAQAPDPAS